MNLVCECSNHNKITEWNEIEQMKVNQLERLEVDANRWRTLYKCKMCKLFWELHYTGGRWDGEPELVRVTSEYISKNWGTQYL